MFLLVELVLPSNSGLLNKTYGTLEFISPGDEEASLSGARSWCKQHGSTLAEITSEHIWNRTLQFVDEFELSGDSLILNANGKELPAWQWITGETFQDVDSYPLSIDTGMYGRLSRIGNQNLSITNSFPNCGSGCSDGYVCEHPGDGSYKVTQSSDSLPLDGNCYVFHHVKNISWFEAYYECYKKQWKAGYIQEYQEEGSDYCSTIRTWKEILDRIIQIQMKMGRFKGTARVF